MQVPLKHHYSPVFYLNRWAEQDGELCVFSRPHKEITYRFKPAKKTGYEERLYEMKGLPPEQAQQIEEHFMKPLDDAAAKALAMLENGDQRINTDPVARSAFSSFLMSMLTRTPEDIAALKNIIAGDWAASLEGLADKYSAIRKPGDPETLKEYLDVRDPHDIERWAVSLIPNMMSLSNLGNLLNSMLWTVKHIPENAGELFTSDRPIVMSAALKGNDAYLILPLGPKMFFAAVNTIEAWLGLEAQDPAQQVEIINLAVVGAAVKFVYARDASNFDYVKTHMGMRPRKRLLEQMPDFRRRRANS